MKLLAACILIGLVFCIIGPISAAVVTMIVIANAFNGSAHDDGNL